MLQPPAAPWVAALFPVVVVIYVGAGLVAWLRRPSSRLGLVMLLGGGAWLLAGLVNTQPPPLVAVGAMTRTLGLAVIVHMLLSFPTGRLRRAPERAVVAAGYAICTLVEAPIWLFAPAGPLAVADRPEVVDAAITTQRVLGALLVVATTAILLRRLRHASRAQRRVLAPLSLYGILVLLVVGVSGILYRGGLTVSAIQLGLIALVPVAFAVGASLGGFARTAHIADLGAWLGERDGARPALRQALADTLGDPSLLLLFRLPGDDVLVDERGTAVPAPAVDGARGLVEIELGGEPVGAISYDAVLLDRPAEIREAGRVIALALDRERLIVALRASRSRLVAAADDERRRIARDLHDGLQSRLVLLAVQAATGVDAGSLRLEIDAAIDELRDLVDGVMPTQLIDRGLPAAVEDLADRLPQPLTLHVVGFEERLPRSVETAAWFVVSEAIVNAVKHAGAAALEVTLVRADGHLLIEVTDDGPGGALIGGGGGLRGMDDRVAALGGRLGVRSGDDGTRVQAVIPCGS
jgi:signal transduction histidine kinase